jgi:hypothetical protein
MYRTFGTELDLASYRISTDTIQALYTISCYITYTISKLSLVDQLGRGYLTHSQLILGTNCRLGKLALLSNFTTFRCLENLYSQIQWFTFYLYGLEKLH